MKVLSQDRLKLFALIAMLVDHIAQIFLSQTVTGCLLRSTIGRTVFPIFCILLAQHLATQNCFGKYIKRLSIFTFISQIILFPFIGMDLNIFFSLLVATVFLEFCHEGNKNNLSSMQRCLAYIILFIGCALLSILCPYEIFGFLFIISLYQWFKFKWKPFAVFALLCSFLLNWSPNTPLIFGISGFLTALVILPCSLGGRRFLGKWYWFYSFYPAHLLFLYLLKEIIS